MYFAPRAKRSQDVQHSVQSNNKAEGKKAKSGMRRKKALLYTASQSAAPHCTGSSSGQLLGTCTTSRVDEKRKTKKLKKIAEAEPANLTRPPGKYRNSSTYR